MPRFVGYSEQRPYLWYVDFDDRTVEPAAETISKAPDSAVVSIDLFEFRSPTGPATLVQEFTSKREPGYARASMKDIPGSHTIAGTGPREIFHLIGADPSVASTWPPTWRESRGESCPD